MNIEYRGSHISGKSVKTTLAYWLSGAMLAVLATAGLAETTATPPAVEAAATTQASGDASTTKSDSKVKPRSAAPKRAAGQRMVFDHLKTGFELLGYHKQVKCEECHIKGVFRGTPRECATCHAVGSRFLTATTMSPKHFQVGNKACDDCHVTSDWNSVNVHHDSGMMGKCNSCHDGTHATGEPASHFPTQQSSCDYCHSTYTWQKAFFDHASFFAAVGVSQPRCDSCHNGSRAQGPGAMHIPIYGADCNTCHGPAPLGNIGLTLGNYIGWWKTNVSFDHNDGRYAATVANCSYCHNGVLEDGKNTSTTHIPTTAQCTPCHAKPVTGIVKDPGNFAIPTLTSAPTLANIHAGITGNCTACHGSSFAETNPTSPMPTPINKLGSHIPTTAVTNGAACETCHTPLNFTAGGFNIKAKVPMMVHTGITSACATCHDVGSSFQNGLATPTLVTKLANHIPTTAMANGAVCETCHSASSFTQPGGFRLATPNLAAIHNGITSGCSTCHDAGQPLPQGITSSVNFGSGSVTTLVVRPGATVAGGPAVGYDHPQTGDCSGCHVTIAAGGFAISVQGAGMPTGHFPTTQTCSLCHGSGYGVGLSQMNHSGASTTCATGGCHDGTGFTMTFSAKSPVTIVPVGKVTAGVTHITTSVDCSVCHKAAAPTLTVMTAAPTYTAGGSFKVSSYISDLHSYVSTTTCSNCHSGGTTYTGMVNVGTIAAAVGSLTTQPATITGCATGTGTHGALGECTNCHQSKVIPSTATTGFCSVGLPAGHFTTTQACSLCHATGYSLGQTKMDHTGITGNCNSCHNGVSFTVANVKVTPVNPSTVTHIPLASGDCSNCHVTSNIPVVTVSSNTPGYTIGTGFKVASYVSNLHSYVSVSSCANCHDSGTSFTGMTPIQTIAASVGSITSTPASIAGCSTGSGPHGALGECVSCHTVGNIAMPSTASTGFCAKTTLPSGHFTTTQTCGLCHANGYGLGKSVMDHTGITTCNACHTGQTFTVSGVSVKPVNLTSTGVNHMPFTGSTDCSICHNAAAPIVTVSASTPSYTAGGTFKVASYISTLHTYVATGTCATCHDSGGTAYTGLAKILTIPAPVGSISSTPTTIAGCTANAGATHPAAGGVCNTCHTSTVMPSTATTGFCGASMMPSNHFAVTGACSLCHANGYALGTSVMDHSGVSLASCNACHSGTAMTIKTSSFTPVSTASVTHIPVTGDCVNCHSASSIPTKVVNATATYTVGSGFKVTSYVATLHNYVTAGDCTACHDNKSFTGMSPVQRVPATLGTIASTPATVQGCTTSGTAHGAIGTCSNCHFVSAIVVPGGPSTGFCAATGVAPAGHIPFTGACSACHSGGTSLGTTVMNHTAASNVCTTCHGMSTPITFPAGGGTTPVAGGANHIPVSSTTCSNCHGTAPATVLVTGSTQNNGRFRMTTYPANLHSFVSTATCTTCHGGSLFNGITATQGTQVAPVGRIVIKPANVTDCSTGNGAHPTVTGDCSGCHFQPNIPGTPTTGFCGAASMPANHIPNPANLACSICHAPGAPTGPLGLGPTGTMVHTGIASNCTLCHGGTAFAGVTPASKNTHPQHIPTTQPCELCHYNNVFTVGTGFQIPASKMSHTGIAAGTCNTCHAGSATAYYGITIVVKPTFTGHSLFEMGTGQCDTCHKGGTAIGGFNTGSNMYHGAIAWTTTMDNNCRSCHASSSTWSGGAPERVQTDSHNAPKNCSSSGCHKPTGTRGTAFSSWD